MKKLILNETQFKLYVEHLKEYASPVVSSSTSSSYSSSSTANKNGSINMKKRDANPNDIKKYTDKGINVSLIDEVKTSLDESDFLKNYFAEEVDMSLEEDMSESGGFSLEKLEMLPSFSKRMAYCKQHLKYLGAGSGRAVFDLNDGEYVLKLAKNMKGLKQNAVEGTNDTDYFDILARCKYYEQKVGYTFFVIMEKAEKINEATFLKLTDMKFKEFQQLFYGNSGRSPRDMFTDKLFQYAEDIGTDNAITFSNDIQEYIYGTDLNAIGDMARIVNWGMIDREGHPTIVLLDHGLDDEVFNSAYRRR